MARNSEPKRRHPVLWAISTFFIALVVVGRTSPVGEDGQFQVSAVGALCVFVLPIVVAIIIHKYFPYVTSPKPKPKAAKPMQSQKTSRRTDKLVDADLETFKIPFSFSARKELADNLIADLSVNVSLANKSKSVSMFVHWYDAAIVDWKKLSILEGKVTLKCENPTLAHDRFIREFQWHLCDAIERHKDEAISNIYSKYRNSQEFQQREASIFELSINDLRPRFSDGTAEFADKAIEEVNCAAGIYKKSDPALLNEFTQTVERHMQSKRNPEKVDLSPFIKDEENWRREMRGLPSAEEELEKIDRMEGHDFEDWCADLLKRNGFENVKVTPGSNDQGVDVLAEKGGVKYAIQCKRYSTDPGNKPVQEVLAGKAIYNCHVGAVMTNRYFTQGGKDAAAATGVLLWDRDKLEEMIQAQ